MAHSCVVELKFTLITREANLSYAGDVVIFMNASKAAERPEMDWTIIPPQSSFCGKVATSNRVTMPKFVAPPFRALQRLGFAVELAFMMTPDASTI